MGDLRSFVVEALGPRRENQVDSVLKILSSPEVGAECKEDLLVFEEPVWERLSLNITVKGLLRAGLRVQDPSSPQDHGHKETKRELHRVVTETGLPSPSRNTPGTPLNRITTETPRLSVRPLTPNGRASPQPTLPSAGSDIYASEDTLSKLATALKKRQPWTCPTCTYLNKGTVYSCEMCFAQAPDSKNFASQSDAYTAKKNCTVGSSYGRSGDQFGVDSPRREIEEKSYY